MPQIIEVPGIGQVEFPDGMTDDQIATAIKSNMSAAAAPAKAGGSNLGNFAAGLVRGAGSIGATILAPIDIVSDAIDGKGFSLESNRERRAGIDGGLQALGAQPDSFLYKGGKLAGEIAGTAGVGGLAANGIRALSNAPTAAALANAVASGGLRTGATMGTAANIATRAGGGAIQGGLSSAIIDPEQAGAGAAFGALLPGTMHLAGSTTRAAFGTARAAIEPFTSAGRQAIAGRVLQQAAGESAPDVARRLAAAAPVVPGSLPTAAQVAESGGLAALERAVSAVNPEPFAKRSMDQAAARLETLRSIARDAPARAAAVEARRAVTSPLYEQATRANYTVTPGLQRLLETPAMAQAMERAKRLAENNQRTFTFNVEPPSPFSGLGVKGPAASTQITGQGLQDLKMAIDDMLKDPTTGFQGSAGEAVRSLRGRLINFMEGANPAFRDARTRYAELSKPISQMDIGEALYEKLRPALADHGSVSRETGNAYATALRNADQTAVRATKFKGAGMADVMTPEQMESLGAIAKDLARKVNSQELGRGPGSDTAQKLAFQNLIGNNIAEQSGYPRLARAVPAAAGAALGATFGGGVGAGAGAAIGAGLGKGAGALYKGSNTELQSLIAQALLDPGMASGLMTRAATGPAALGGASRQAITSDQAEMIAALFARVAPIALSR